MFAIATAVIIICAAALAAAAFSTSSARRTARRCAALEAQLARIQRELELAAGLAVKTGAQVKRVERDYGGVAERLGLLELRGESRPYDQAIASARRGSDPTRLARQFGLSSTEAKLLILVHGSRQNA